MYYFKQPKYTSLHTYACGSMSVPCKCSQTQWLIPLATASHHKHLIFFLKCTPFRKKNMLFLPALLWHSSPELGWTTFAQLGINNTWPVLICGQPLPRHQALTGGHSVCWTRVAWEEPICYSHPWHRLITWLEGANNGMCGFKRALHHCPQHFHCNKT